MNVPTGVFIAMPHDLYGRITGRSSSIRSGLLVYEGIIDPGYRGELFAAVRNLNDVTLRIEEGTRVAQLVFAPAIRPMLVVQEHLPSSTRGEKGFGSSGQ